MFTRGRHKQNHAAAMGAERTLDGGQEICTGTWLTAVGIRTCTCATEPSTRPPTGFLLESGFDLQTAMRSGRRVVDVA